MNATTVIILLSLFGIVVFILLKLNHNRNLSPSSTSSPSTSPAASPTFSPSTSPAASPTSSPSTSPAASSVLPPGCSLEMPWKFYARSSVDGQHGVDDYGNLSNPGKVINNNWKTMTDEVDNEAYYLPPPYRRKGVSSWSKTVQYALNSGDYTRVFASDRHRVLLVEAPAKIVIGSSLDLEGLVVRRGGSVLICPLPGEENTLTLSLEFVLVESGGLLQCGYAGDPDSLTDDSARLDPQLRVVVQMLNSSYGYFKSGVPCSQYPPHILQPGATLQDSCCSDYKGVKGTCITNAVGTKSLAVLFNGNLHFAGHIPQSVPYKIWKASTKDTSTEDSYLVDIPLQIADKKAASEYPYTWTSISGSAIKGDQAISVSGPETALQDWLPGSQVVITSLSNPWSHETAAMDGECEYSTSGRGAENFHECTPGAMPFYVHENGNDVPPHKGSYGIEICTIAYVKNSTIFLTEPLQFNHAQQPTSKFTDTSENDVTVETPVHVGLLTRNITIKGREKTETTETKATLQTKTDGAFWGAPLHSSKNASVKDIMKALPRGKFNKVMAGMKMEAVGTSSTQVDDQNTWLGPGGSIVCNRHTKNFSSTPPSIYKTLQTSALKMPIGEFLHSDEYMPSYECATDAPSSNYRPRGSYLLGDADCTGLSCIVGGSVKIQYAAAFVFDGVELYQMGLPGNCGSLGQYSIHFHCAGWGPRFTLYAKDGAVRHLRFCNSCNWRSYSRWLTLHGVNFAHVSNNIFCTCMGNGIFFEDGVEHNNSIEHNLMCNCVMTGQGTDKLNVYNETQNPSAVIGNGGFDNYPVASIWLTNTYNFIFRNVFCNNGASGVAVWTIPVNPRTKSGPANLCTGYAPLKLPGFIGRSLIGYSNGKNKERWLDRECVPDDMHDLFVTLTADSSYEARGNVKNFADNPSVQTYVLFAENTLYSLTGGIIEANNESTVWVDKNFQGIETSVNYVPINGETTGELVSNNPQTYTIAASTPSKKGSGADETQARDLVRAFFQNRVYALYGLKVYQLGGFVWTQRGVVAGFGNCVLGGDYWSAGSSSKVANNNPLALGNFSCIHVDLVTNCSLAGSGGMQLKLGCQGVLVSGSKTILGKSTCVGARTAVPKGAKALACIPQDDDAQPSFVMFGEEITYTDGLKQLIRSWLLNYKSFEPLGLENKPSGIYPALGGVSAKGSGCCKKTFKGNYDFLCDPSAEDIDYVFVVNAQVRISYNSVSRDIVEKNWPSTKTINCAGQNIDLCDSNCKGAVNYASDIYPAFKNSLVLSKWSQICRYVALSPGISPQLLDGPAAANPSPSIGQPCHSMLSEKGYNLVVRDCGLQFAGACASRKGDATPQCIKDTHYASYDCPSDISIKCTISLGSPFLENY